MSTGLAVFDTTVNESNQWLKSLQDELRVSDRHQAYGALRAGLHALRDRLSPGGAMRLAAQLPLLLRGMFVEGWRPDESPVRTHTLAAFAATVQEALPPDFPFDGEAVARAVIKVMYRRTAGGAMAKVKEEVPEALRALWPPEPFVA